MTTPTPTLRERVRTAIEAHVHRDPGGLVAWVDEDGATEAVLALLADAGGAPTPDDIYEEIAQAESAFETDPTTPGPLCIYAGGRVYDRFIAPTQVRLRAAEERARQADGEKMVAEMANDELQERMTWWRERWTAESNTVAALQARERELVKALCFARSVILSGESMTPQAEAIFDAALTRAPQGGKPKTRAWHALALDILKRDASAPRPETAGEQG